MKIQLKDIAYARSGDKGDICNIGLMAKNMEAYEIIKREVSPERVRNLFKGVVKGNIEIYDLPNLQAINVILRNALGGGATSTLRFDQTGKSMGNALLRMEIEIDSDLLTLFSP
jgi:hypothetical protein